MRYLEVINMSVSLNRERNGVEGIDLCIPVSTERFFREVWERAIEEVDTKYFREYKSFYRSQLGEVSTELIQIKKWAIKNLNGTDLKYISERIDEILEQLPNAFEREDAILTLY